MAYYVIARDPKTHDEWVMPKTLDTILETAEYVEHCKTSDPRFRYRLEGTGEKVEKLRTEDFTVAELFPNVGNGYTTQDCNECGALVNLPQSETHATWHNKLLP